MRKKTVIDSVRKEIERIRKLNLEELNAESERCFKSLLCKEVKDNDLLITLEKGGLSYRQLERYIREMTIPKVKGKNRLERLRNFHKIIDEAIEQIAYAPKAHKAYELKKYDSLRFDNLLETIEQLNSLSRSEFINSGLKPVLIAESERISDEYDLAAFHSALREYFDQVDEKITTDRYSAGKTINSIYKYLKQKFPGITQDQVFSLIADIFNSGHSLCVRLRVKINNDANQNFTSKKVRDLYTNYIQKKS